MASTSLLVLFLLALTCCFVSNPLAFQLLVGGRDGWVVNPVESYDHWARRLRFQVNDTIIFRYSNATDSVLEVSKEDYENCNVDHPLIKLNDGNSVFKFGHSGPFYFITGNKTNCEKGQKLLIVVLAVRSPPAVPALPPVSPPTSAPSPSTAISPSSPAPAGSSPAPSVSPAAAPSVSPAAAPSVSPAAAPSVTPAAAPSVTPAAAPAVSPAAAPAVSPTAAPAVTPAAAPAVTPAAGPGSSLAPIAPGPLAPSSPGGIAPAAENAPADVSPPSGSPARSSATLTFIPTAVSTMAVSIVFIAMTSAWSVIA